MDLEQKLQRFQAALHAFVERCEADRWVLAVVLDGSLNDETIWHTDDVDVWVIVTDGTIARRKSDGEEPRTFRTFVEDDVDLSAELIERSTFKRMVEGTSRSNFSCNFFARRELVWSRDASIAGWFASADTAARKDQNRELLAVTTWVIAGVKWTKKLLDIKGDVPRAVQAATGTANALAALHIVMGGQIVESAAIYYALEQEPELFGTVYLDVLAKRDADAVRAALATIDAFLDDHAEAHLGPLLSVLRKHPDAMPLSALADHFATTQLYPWHLESACEWLVDRGLAVKMALPMPLTKKSKELAEEPAWQIS